MNDQNQWMEHGQAWYVHLKSPFPPSLHRKPIPLLLLISPCASSMNLDTVYLSNWSDRPSSLLCFPLLSLFHPQGRLRPLPSLPPSPRSPSRASTILTPSSELLSYRSFSWSLNFRFSLECGGHSSSHLSSLLYLDRRRNTLQNARSDTFPSLQNIAGKNELRWCTPLSLTLIIYFFPKCKRLIIQQIKMWQVIVT